MLHAADGNIPSERSTQSPEEIEEERRLFYVALTRAKDWLYAMVPQRYYFARGYQGDAHSYAQPSRFLHDEAMKCFEVISGEEASDDGDDDDFSRSASQTRSVREGMKKLW